MLDQAGHAKGLGRDIEDDPESLDHSSKGSALIK